MVFTLWTRLLEAQPEQEGYGDDGHGTSGQHIEQGVHEIESRPGSLVVQHFWHAWLRSLLVEGSLLVVAANADRATLVPKTTGKSRYESKFLKLKGVVFFHQGLSSPWCMA